MKTILSICFVVAVASCCLSSTKCPMNFTFASFRFLDASGQQDLLFGPTSIYSSDSIRFYSLNPGDTLFYPYSVLPGSNITADSVIRIDFGTHRNQAVFVALAPGERDTLILEHWVHEASACCPDYIKVTPTYYNRQRLQTSGTGITVIQK